MKNVFRITLAICLFSVICIFISGCADTKSNDQIEFSSIYTSNTKFETITEEIVIPTKNSETIETNKKVIKNKKETVEDPYNAKDYPNEDWFYEDHYDDFDSFEDAEDYYNEFYD